MTKAIQPERWKLAIVEADEGEANALASRLRDGRLEVHFFEDDDPLPRLLSGGFDLVLVRQHRSGPGGLMICNRLLEELGQRRPNCFLLVDQLTDEAIEKHQEVKGSVDAYFKAWPEPEVLTEQALEQLAQRPKDEQTVPPATHQAVNDPMEVEVELPEPVSMSELPALQTQDDDDELFVGDSDRRVELLRERLAGQDVELAKMRRAWRQRETALRKADGYLRQKDVELERLRHDYSRLKQELETLEVQGRTELDASEAQRSEQAKTIDQVQGELEQARDRARIERERRDNEIAQLSRELELAEEARSQLIAEQRQAREEQRQAAQALKQEQQATESALKDRLSDADQKMTEQREESASHLASIADLNSKVDALAAQLADRASELSAASALRAQLDEQIQASQTAHGQAEAQWQQTKEQRAARIAELEAQLRHEQGERRAAEDEARVHVESLEAQRGSLEVSLSERREELISTRTRLETELERQAAQLGEARQEVAQLVTEMEDRSNQAELREERQREEAAQLARKLASAEARIEGQDETLQREREAAQRATVDHQQREQERREEASALRVQIEEIQQAHEAAAQTLRQRLDEAAERSAAGKALEADLKGRLRSAVEGRDQAVAQIERQAEDHRGQLDEYKSDLAARQQHIEGLEEALGGRDETINELGSTVAGLEVALEQNQNQAHEWKERSALVESKAESLLADVERLRGQLDAQGEEFMTLKVAHKDQEHSLVDLRTELTQNEGQRVDLEKQLNFVQSEQKRADSELEEQRAQRRELEEELAGREVEAEDLRQNLRQAHTERDQIQHEHDTLESKSDLQLDEVRQLREQVAELEGRYRGLEGQLERSRSAVESREAELASSREQGQVARGELGQARSEVESLTRRVEELETKLSEVSTQRSDLGQRLSSAEKSVATTQAQADEQRDLVGELRKGIAAEQARSEGLEERLKTAQLRAHELEEEADRARQLDQELQRRNDGHREELGQLQVTLAANQQALSEVEHRAEESQGRTTELLEDLQRRGDEQAQQAELVKELRGKIRVAEEESRHQRQALEQYREDRAQLEGQFKQFRQAREQLVTDVRSRLDSMHERLTGKEQELADAQRRVEDLQRSQAEPARLAKRQAEAHEAEVGRLRERLEAAEVKVRSKVAELAGIKEELSASRQDAQSSDRAMRDQLSQVEERLATTTRDLQLSQLPQPVAEPEEVGELRRQLSAERNRRERLLKESNERLRKAHEVMAKMRKTLERLGLVTQEEQSQASTGNEALKALEAPIKDANPAENPAKLERPTLPKPSLNPPIGDPTLLPDVVESIELPKQTALAEEPEFSDDPPPVIDED